jgi:hypothetical protein
MTNQHPITPPPELVREWNQDAIGTHFEPYGYSEFIATRAAQWGADQELLACGNYLKQCAAWEEEDVTEFYNYRRPRPLSLKELALESVKRFEKSGEFFSDQMRELEFIRKALETIDD